MDSQRTLSFDEVDKIALISDIHANYPALEAVLNDIARKGIKTIWLLGDSLGRGPYPVEIFHWMQVTFFKEKNLIIRGNHDDWIVEEGGKPAGNNANPMFVASDTREFHELIQESNFVEWMNKVPVAYSVVINSRFGFFITHEHFANSRNEVCYPWNSVEIEENFAWLERQDQKWCNVMLLGHSHIPMLCSEYNGHVESRKVIPFETYSLSDARSWIINPGSVGYPIDDDPRASYGILDLRLGTYQLIKKGYPIQETANKIIEKQYPRSIIQQLMTAPLPGSVPYDWLDHFEKAREIKESNE
jgi:predicted phosphodiesterase